MDQQEHALFEQRLLEPEGGGVAIRKINQHGKSNLRYVRCVTVEASSVPIATSAATHFSLGKRSVRRPSGVSSSASSLGGESLPLPSSSSAAVNNSYRALSWGKKKDVQIAVRLFTAVVQGKHTIRARRSPAPDFRILSLLTSDPHHASLDIEAPTKMDRDKFALAFSRFLSVPLYEEADAARGFIRGSNSSSDAPFHSTLNEDVLSSATPSSSYKDSASETAALAGTTAEMEVFAVPFLPSDWVATSTAPASAPNDTSEPWLSNASPAPETTLLQQQPEDNVRSISSSHSEKIQHEEEEMIISNTAIVSLVPPTEDAEQRSHMSSLTGHGYDQELVEELHNALNELRVELEDSRAEAARAVKVAEQAIQSAEKSNSLEWQNTVTHKAAEAAALAQKRSAAAMAKQRLAEERLESERRAAAFWRSQAEIAEASAGVLQTRAAAAEVQRAALAEQLLRDRRMAQEQLMQLRGRYSSTDATQRDALEAAWERSRVLELELDATRRDLQSQRDEMTEQMYLLNDEEGGKNRKVKRNFGRKKKGDGMDSTSLLSENMLLSSSALVASSSSGPMDPSSSELFASSYSSENGLSTEQVLKIYSETQLMRQQFEMLKRATADQLEQLPDNLRLWGQQIAQSLHSAQDEVARLSERLAMESANRRKLLHEVQDLRGAVRVYCRPRPGAEYDDFISIPSAESIVFHCDKYDDELGPVSLEFDRVFEPNTPQQDVFVEVEEVCLGVLDGYNICILAYGPANCGKTHTILGDIEMTPDKKIGIQNHGIHLQAMDQLFSIAQHRRERYKDTFSLTIIEVHNDRIRDLVAATETGGSRGHVMVAETKNAVVKRTKGPDDDASSGRPSKLEIRTDIHGDTVVQGLVAVEVKSMEDVLGLWEECLAVQARRLEEQGLDSKQYDAANHVMATLRVKSLNIATGIGTIGKIQFVDLAAADIVPRTISPLPPGEGEENAATSLAHQTDWRFVNRSLETFSECIEARMQYDRSVPYRNSTLTHLLRDSLEADTKVLLFACVSCDPERMTETASVLKFASRIRRVIIGKATKHILSS